MDNPAEDVPRIVLFSLSRWGFSPGVLDIEFKDFQPLFVGVEIGLG